MGCDIHAVLERKAKNSKHYWVSAGNPEIGRDYEMYALMAGVRNEDELAPISEPKGVPEDASSEFEALYDVWDADAHSASYLTLAELKSADLEQEFFDESLITRRDTEGKIIETCGATNGKHEGPVGSRKVFALWGRKRWDELLAQLESLKREGDTDEDVRICFFFDN